jgi:hypothetical protein
MLVGICQVVCIDVFPTKIMLRDQHPRRQPHNFRVTQSMPWNHHTRVGIFRIDSCKTTVAEGKLESAFASFFETQRNMQYCMMFKPMTKHNPPYIFITPECVSNYGGYLPIFIKKMIRI